MDDKLINLIITVAVIAGWAVQFFLKPKKGAEEEQHFDEDEKDKQPTRRAQKNKSGDNPYAEDPYIKVQEDIRRMIAERQAAERAASQSGRSMGNQPSLSPVEKARRARDAARTLGENQTAAKQLAPDSGTRPTPTGSDAARAAANRPQTATADRTLRPTPQTRQPDRSFPAARPKPAAPHSPFPAPAVQNSFPSPSGQSNLSPISTSASAYQQSGTSRNRSHHYDSLRGRLRDPAAAREAIVLREILGPPTALQKDRQF